MKLSAELENDLKKCLKIMDDNWNIQNNKADTDTNFIYKAQSLDECLKQIEKNKADKNYSLHRWYNYMTSVYCEYIFCDFGAVHEKDKYNHDVDIYINNVPFDVKLTVYPAVLSGKPYDLKDRDGKNKMIRWFYANQSQGSRKQLINRLYVVCDGESVKERNAKKSDFDLMRKQIGNFMSYIKRNNYRVNEIAVSDGENDYSLNSEIIYIP